MSTRKRWRMRFVPGGPSRSYPSKAAVYRAVAARVEDVRLGIWHTGTREARVYCDDQLYEVITLADLVGMTAPTQPDLDPQVSAPARTLSATDGAT